MFKSLLDIICEQYHQNRVNLREGSLGVTNLDTAQGEILPEDFQVLPEDVLCFHSQNTDQPRTVKLLSNATRTEEIFGSHSSSACLRFVREDSLFKPGTCFDKDWSTCVTLVLKTPFVRTGSLQSLPFSCQTPGASRTQSKLSERRKPRLLVGRALQLLQNLCTRITEYQTAFSSHAA